jgi:hypothetical protein
VRGDYIPCRTGLHACEFNPARNWFRTVANAPLPEPGARHVWEAAHRGLGATGDDVEVMVDLFIEGQFHRNFGIRRQHVGDLLVLAENYIDWSKAPFHAE